MNASARAQLGFCIPYSSGSHDQRTAPPTVKMGFPTAINTIKIIPHKHGRRSLLGASRFCQHQLENTAEAQQGQKSRPAVSFCHPCYQPRKSCDYESRIPLWN